MAWGIFNKVKNIISNPVSTVIDVAKAHAKAARGVMNYFDKATTVKAEALDKISPFIPQLKPIAPVLLIADRLRKKITDPIVKTVNKINLD